jgi:hypothetical protein
MVEMNYILLPLNLEELPLERFDQLVESGELFYRPSIPENLEHNGFKVSDEREALSFRCTNYPEVGNPNSGADSIAIQVPHHRSSEEEAYYGSW